MERWDYISELENPNNKLKAALSPGDDSLRVCHPQEPSQVLQLL